MILFHSCYRVRKGKTILWFFFVVSLCICIQAFQGPTITTTTTTTSSGKTNHHLLILGFGRVGKEIAQDALPYFTSITATVRHGKPNNHNNNNNNKTNCSTTTTTTTWMDGIQIIPFQNQYIQSILPQCTHIVITLPPPPSTTNDTELDTVLDSIDTYFPKHGWIGILSTTGVYGNHYGAWVTEESKCVSTTSPNAQLYLQWEQLFRQKCLYNHQQHHQLTIFRCSGIYGLGRSALHTIYQQEGWITTNRTLDTTKTSSSTTTTTTTTTKQSSSSSSSSSNLVTNRIHSKDLSRVIIAAMIQSRIYNNHTTNHHHNNTNNDDIELYNVSDDLPESRHVVFQYARHLFWKHQKLKQPWSTITRTNHSQPRSNTTTTTTTTRRLRRETEEKRVSNQRMKDILLKGESLLFPTYREGLDYIFQQPTEPWWGA